jgi:hypothetical protein
MWRGEGKSKIDVREEVREVEVVGVRDDERYMLLFDLLPPSFFKTEAVVVRTKV